MAEAAAAVSALPESFGNWKAERFEMGESERKQTGTVGWFTAKVRNTSDNNEASLMLLCGQTRPLSVHPPTVCFQGAGLELVGSTHKIRVPRREGNGSWGEFMQGDFKPVDGGGGGGLRTYWAWSRDGQKWEAPDIPRFSFSGAPYLYKIYVTRIVASADPNGPQARRQTSSEKPGARRSTADGTELCEVVLNDFLTEFQTSLPETK
jgi:hypothetical protein